MRAARLGLGLGILSALTLHGWAMGPQNLPHLLWSCHVASIALALGLLFNRRLLVSAGFLFHLGIGFPAWLVQVVLTRGTFGAPTVTPRVLATSILVHLLPLLAGAIYQRRRPITARAVALAWLFQIAMVPLSRWLTPPDLNVNLAHTMWLPLASAFTNIWIFHLALSMVALAALVFVRSVWNKMVAVVEL